MQAKLKRIKHSFDKQKYEAKLRQREKNKDKMAVEGKYKQLNDIVINAVPKKYINNDSYLNSHRKSTIDVLLRNKPSKRTSRLALAGYENQVMQILGIVADIDTSTHSPRILLESATLLDNNGKMLQYIDQHLWLFVKNLVGHGIDLVGNQEVSIGDYMLISAVIKPYRGKSNTIKHSTYRWGIGKYILEEVGQPTQRPSKEYKNKSALVFINKYNRFGDWVIKFHKLPLVNSEKLLYYKEKPAYTFTIKSSAYPSYQERLSIK